MYASMYGDMHYINTTASFSAVNIACKKNLTHLHLSCDAAPRAMGFMVRIHLTPSSL